MGGLLTVVTVTLVGVLVLRRRKTFAGKNVSY